MRRAVENSTLDVCSNTADLQLGDIWRSQGPRSAVKLVVWPWWWRHWHSVSPKLKWRGRLSEHLSSPFQLSDYKRATNMISSHLLCSLTPFSLSWAKLRFFSWPTWTFFFYCYLSCSQTDRFQLALMLNWRQIFPRSKGTYRFSSLQWNVGNPALVGKLSKVKQESD